MVALNVTTLGKGRWGWLWWMFGAIVIVASTIYLLLFLYGGYLHGEKYATEDAVAYIESQKLTLADVRGDNLPPPPDAADTTLEGVDQNLNGIRDDVELAIFEMYPDDAKVRAAELQYAKALQLELTNWIFNEETFVAVLLQGSRGHSCVYDTGPEVNLSMSQEEVEKRFAVGDGRVEEVENLVFNTEKRKQKRDEVYGKYMTSHGDSEGPDCDIDLSVL